MRSGLLPLNIERLGVIGIGVLMMLSCGEDKPPMPVPDPPTFRVGGTITGLSGSLTLQLNGAESLTRSENGAFTFQSRLVDESEFTVALGTTPAEQDCTLQGATGKVHGADVDSVRVTCAQRTYSLGGTVEGLNGTLLLRIEGGETLSITANGPFTFQTRLPAGGTYAVAVATQPASHECAVTNGSGTVAGNVTGITVRCMPWFELTTFQAATIVIGQNDFTSKLPSQGGSGPGPATLARPWGNPVFAGGKLYVSDSSVSRVLGFNGLPSQNGASASFVLGQPDFTSDMEHSGREGFSVPEGLSTDGTRLAVTDKSNSRILIFNTLPAATAAEPDLVLGQPDFTSTTSSECDRDSLSIPEDVSISHGKLVVADSANSRVLIWTLPTSNGAPAELVLGQTSFTTCTGNDADGDGLRDAAPTASTLFYPGGVWTDGTRLLVADTDNNRVLLWNQFPTRNGQPADVVLGQPNFITRTANTTSTGMEAPYNITSTGRQIFVAEHVNNRVLVWNQIPTVSDNGIAADVVLGQPDFTSRNAGDPSPGTTPSARSLYRPSGILVAWPYLGVVDYGNNRLLLFEGR
jgi:hypothetical protein